MNKKREEEKIAAFFKDNAIKRMAEERRQRLAAEQQEAEKREEQRKASQALTDVFEVGQRVFHEQMGIGHITDVMNVGESVMYTVDFWQARQKSYGCNLRKVEKVLSIIYLIIISRIIEGRFGNVVSDK